MVTRLSVEDAARVLGISQPTIKRRLKRGTLRGDRAPTSSGFKWYVLIDEPATPVATPTTPAATSSGVAGVAGDAADGIAADIPSAPPQTALLAQRAREMAEYTRELQAPLLARLEAQAERIGRLEAENEGLPARLAAAAPRADRGAAPRAGGRRPGWWERFVWELRGASGA
jgi:hypothetical protein